ncbi:peptide chain release factor N(5)-glutamine methyltransferase [Caenibacillus caldisaponilyticus]|uniref:peptide chain release factor N(5)-glutamine methyltransferase n=1 Tax=Caenibacillus caldisaponilyticus TaxID=1674942 RepID=UPI0009884ACE
MPAIYEALKRASSFLKERGREARAAEILLLHRLGKTRSELLADWRKPLAPEDWEWFCDRVTRHADGVPVQYLTETEWFFGRAFRVTPDVLIPRPETEELVAETLKRLKALRDGPVRVLDVGTGSGVIAVTLALEHADCEVTAVDLSREALAVARDNAERLGARVRFVHGDLLSPFLAAGETFDCIVSNPPYIPSQEIGRLDPLVKDHEPRLALDGGSDGLEVYRRLCRDLPQVLRRPGLVAFEIGEGQGRAVAEILAAAFSSHADIEILKDINGHERIVLARIDTNGLYGVNAGA